MPESSNFHIQIKTPPIAKLWPWEVFSNYIYFKYKVKEENSSAITTLYENGRFILSLYYNCKKL